MFRFIPVLAGTIHLTIALISPGTSDFWDLIVYNGLLLITALWLLLRGERAIGCAIGSWAMGSTYSAIIELTGLNSPTLASGIGFIAFYPILFYFILRSQQFTRVSRSQIIDSLIITVGISSLVTALSLSATSNAESITEIFLLTLYPIGDLLLIFLLIIIGLRDGVSREYFTLFIAITIFAISDIGYLWLYSRGDYALGGLVDEGWLVALLLLAATSRLPKNGNRILNTYPPIFIALALALSTLGWYALNPQERSPILLIPAIATLLLAFTRMALALEEAEQGKVLRELAITDELTGVGNRREFLTQLGQVPIDSSAWLLLLDLDGFKAINDRYGHAAGDRVLREVAHRFRTALPQESFLGRLGGDEFGVIIYGDEARSQELAHRLELALATPIYVAETAVLLEVSIGAAAITADSHPLEVADVRMYEAKRARHSSRG